jgi:hypothetical protein
LRPDCAQKVRLVGSLLVRSIEDESRFEATLFFGGILSSGVIVNVPFPEDSQRVLRVMIRRPVISGGELGMLTGIPSDQLSQALRPLLSAGIISTGTSTLGSAEIGISYFNLNPSARPLAESAAG